jgi:uncharacterized protein YijF (DUF1287 family)
VAGRGGSSGTGKRSKSGRGPKRDSVPFQRRIDRHHGGPPAHILARQEIDKAKRVARKAAMAASASDVAGPVAATLAATEGQRRAAAVAMPPTVPASAAPITAPRRAVPALPANGGSTARRRPASVPAVQLAVEATAPPASPRRAASRALAAMAVPFVIGIAAIATGIFSSGQPSVPPPVTAPISIAAAPLHSDAAIRQRILEMTPPLALRPLEPAWPSPVEGSIRFASLTLPSGPPEIPVFEAPRVRLAFDEPLPTLPAPTPAFERWPSEQASVSATVPPSEPPLPATGAVPPTAATLPPADEPIDPAIASARHSPGAQCGPAAALIDDAPVAVSDPATFGQALATAAHQQLRQFVVYDARYTRIAYPGGDVATLHGVCTDVVIRAYRALGIDLQRIVFESRIGIGDTSIDHRRTETVRRFLATHGETLPTTPFAEDYLPGDIVTYYRPQNRISTAHIAVVSDQIGPSGRPMIIHNRGLGVQLEDGLFVDRMTGHYRYLGPKTPLPPLAMAARIRPPSGTTTAFATPAAEKAAQGPTATAVPVIRAAAKSPAAQKLALRFAQQQETAANAPASRAATRSVDRPRP